MFEIPKDWELIHKMHHRSGLFARLALDEMQEGQAKSLVYLKLLADKPHSHTQVVVNAESTFDMENFDPNVGNFAVMVDLYRVSNHPTFHRYTTLIQCFRDYGY